MITPIKVMVVEDESLARQGLLLHLKKYENIKVISACASASDAKIALEQATPDAIFLDIEMPGLSGMEFAKELQETYEIAPKIVFVTAFADFAFEAYQVDAIDYLTKPICEDRLRKCITKLEKIFTEHQASNEHKKLADLLVSKTGNSIKTFMHELESTRPGKLNQDTHIISVKSGTEWLRIPLIEISRIEAAGDYMCIYVQGQTHIVRKTLKQLEQDLDPKMFVRISRSAIINTTKIQKLSPNSNGEYYAHLDCGEKVKITRSYKTRLEEIGNIKP